MRQENFNVLISTRRPRSLDEMVGIEEANFAGSPLFQGRDQLVPLAFNPKYVFAAAYLPGWKLVGYCSGTALEKYLDEELPLVAETSPKGFSHSASVYVESIECSPEFHNRGVGTSLLNRFATEATKMGFTHIAGHFREGASHRVAVKVLKGILVDIPVINYGDTGEKSHYLIATIGKPLPGLAPGTS